MHSIIRQGQFHGQLHGQFKSGQFKNSHFTSGQFKSRFQPQGAHPGPARPIQSRAALLSRSDWERRSLMRDATHISGRSVNSSSGRIDICRLIVATLGLALYLALPVAAVSFALRLLFQ